MDDTDLFQAGRLLVMNNKIIISDEFLSSNRRFLDAIIGGILANSKFMSLGKAAKEIGCTERRIGQAVERLQQSGHIIKIHNYILTGIDLGNDLQKIQKFRTELLRYHGIRTPEAVKYRGHLEAVLYAPNSYFLSIDSHGSTGPSLNLTPKKAGRIVPLLKTSQYVLWQFNDRNYNFQAYLTDYGFKHL